MAKALKISARIIKRTPTAMMLGMCRATFDKREPSLIEQGFPAFDTTLGGYDKKAINLWLDKRANLISNNVKKADDAFDEWEKRRAS